MPDQPQGIGQPVPAPTGGEVERFEMMAFCPMEPMNAQMYTDPDGDWVRYEDYDKLKKELEVAKLDQGVPFYDYETP